MTTLPGRIRSRGEAYDALERDIAERKKELSLLMGEVRAQPARDYVRKAAIILSYAHVEGATKASLTVLFLLLNGSGLTWRHLLPSFAHFEIDRHLSRLGPARRVIANDETTRLLRHLPDQQVDIPIDDIVRRIGVVNRDTLRSILSICQIDDARYHSELETFDDLLVARRHQLAHGDLAPIDPGTATSAIQVAIRLLDALLIDFGNLIVQGGYRSEVA